MRFSLSIPPAQGAVTTLLLVALVPRLLAAFFAGGYFAHDDHFLVAEAARSWVDGYDYNDWLPWNQTGTPTPSGHSMFYVGLHYLLFKALVGLGCTGPAGGMVVVRLLHALWSLVVVWAGHRIALRLSDPTIAWRTGLFLALFCYMPFLSVRNLVEVACIPFLMLGAWQLVKDIEGPTSRLALMAGVCIGMAMNVRFQVVFFAAGPGLALLLQRRWLPMFAYGLGLLVPLVLIQGSIDLVIWGRPFAEFGEYVGYNLANTTTYGELPWYNYLLLLAGIFIPPFSLCVIWGYVRRPAPLVVWLPVLLFVAVHSYFPNKQERFLLPIVPLFFVLGYTAWERFRLGSAWWQQRHGLWKGLMVWTLSVNALLLLLFTFSTSKRSRVDAMTLLLGRTDVQGWIVVDSPQHEPPMLPKYYSLQWPATVINVADTNVDLDSTMAVWRAKPGLTPNYAFLIGNEELPARMARIQHAMGPVTVVGVARPGAVDLLVHWLNPVNRNETITVLKVQQ